MQAVNDDSAQGEPPPSRGRRFVGSPCFPALIAALAATAGLLGSVYQEAIARAFPLNLSGPYSEFSGRAAVFWVALLLLAVLVFVRQHVDDEVRKELERATRSAAQTSLRVESIARATEETSKKIERIVQTLPPKAFQTKLATNVAAAHDATASLLPRRLNAARDDTLIVSQKVLKMLAELAFVYDDSPMNDGGPAVYCANVMLFTDDPKVIRDSSISFLPREFDRTWLAGVLRIREGLAAYTDDVARPAPSLCLPVPREAHIKGRAVALPGAPLAFLEGITVGYNDTLTLRNWCQEHGDFSPSAIEELHRYFEGGNGRTIRSFVSRPLYRTAATDDDRPIGVLNIHSDRPNILGPMSERNEAFHALVTPILQDLTDILCESGDVK